VILERDIGENDENGIFSGAHLVHQTALLEFPFSSFSHNLTLQNHNGRRAGDCVGARTSSRPGVGLAWRLGLGLMFGEGLSLWPYAVYGCVTISWSLPY
jgi:hypothetical protein